MAKRLFILAAGAMALTACTSEDVVNDVASSRTAIQFENVVNKLSRADDVTSANMKHFNVFGFYTMPGNPTVANGVFNDVTVTRQDNTQWAYASTPDEVQHWFPDGKYYFYAYNCGNTAQLESKDGTFSLDVTSPGLTAAQRVLTLNNYVCDNTHQHDLIFASNTGAVEGDEFAGIVGQATGNAPVAFQFKHLLTKIKARFTNKFHAEYDVVVKNVSVVNIHNKGSYNPTDGWDDVNHTEGEQPLVHLLNTVDAAVDPIKILNQQSGETNTAFVIPFDYETAAEEGVDSSYVYLNFQIEVYFGENLVMAKELTGKFSPEWIEGYSYIYNVELTGNSTNMDAIIFTTASDANGNIVSTWNEDDTPVVTIDKN